MTANQGDFSLPNTTHPLVYAVFELRVPFSPKLGSPDSAHRLAAMLETLTVLREEPQQRITTAADGSVSLRPESAWRLLNIESSRSCVLSNTSLRYEATRYSGFDRFKDEVRELLDAISEVCPPVGYDRLGLRYVNEVRPPSAIDKFSEWSHWIAPSYIDAIVGAESAIPEFPDHDRALTDCQLVSAETNLQFALPENSAMTLRLVNLHGAGVVGNEPLRRYQLPAPGPFYVVDFDGYWPREPADVELFSPDKIMEQLNRVHDPVKSTFRWATTPDYREEAGVVNH
jgi:uncharacterized protein (TIGR04255 family)